jgi:MYXO-CTERM domain-containing protein
VKSLKTLAPLAFGSILALGSAHAALIVHYDFENNVNDQSGAPVNNGTLLGGAGYIADSPFGSGSSLSTNAGAENQGVNVAGDPSLGSSTFTLAYWIKPTTNQESAASMNGLERLTSRAGDSFETAIGDASAVGGTTSPTGVTLSYFQGTWNVTNVPITIGDWSHVAWVNSVGGMEVFLNGVSAYTGPAVAAPRPGTGLLNIGTRHNNVEGFEGYMDDFRLYDTALSASEVASLAVPEPSGAFLAFVGLAGLTLRRRR